MPQATPRTSPSRDAVLFAGAAGAAGAASANLAAGALAPPLPARPAPAAPAAPAAPPLLRRGAARRILVADYSGHPFQVQLSRALAKRPGRVVRHVFSAAFQTPKGALARRPGDPDGFDVAGLRLEKPFAKDALLKRRAQEIEFGRLLAADITAFSPDVVISSNMPLDAQRIVQRATRRAGARFVFWLQDIYSDAIGKLLSRRLPLIGRAAGGVYRALEMRMLRESDSVVAITDDFVAPLLRAGVDPHRIEVIENWAPLDELAPLPRDNPAAARHLPAGDAVRIVYSGTLGLKHDPSALLALAHALPRARVSVFSEGRFADALAAQGAAQKNFEVAGWVDFSDLPGVLSGADIVVALLEADAGAFSAPSKVLSYLAVGRPVLAAIPHGNLARRLIEETGAGLVAAPGDAEGLIARARRLAEDPALRARMGEAGRAHARRAFDIDAIAARFEALPALAAA